MYINIGKTIKAFSFVFLGLVILSSLLACVALAAEETIDMGYCVLIFFGCSIVGMVISWFIYGFGELIYQTTRIADKVYSEDRDIHYTSRRKYNTVSRPAVVYESPDGSWECSCGRTNSAYTHTCVCGFDRREEAEDDE